MYSNPFGGSKKFLQASLLSILTLLFPHSLRSEVGLRLSGAKAPLSGLVKPAVTPIFSIADSLSAVPVFYPRSFQHAVSIDSSGQFVVSSFRIGQYDFLLPSYFSFEDYLKIKAEREMERMWREYASTHVTTTAERGSGGLGITIESPKIQSRAFKQIFGGETLSLKVTGNITIDGGLRNEKRSQVQTALNRRPMTNFQMKQTQNFKVEGKIGNNVSIFVDQDSERPFEFENAIKLNYNSDEDGIVQSIEAGNISLQLPGTRFVTFSQTSTGLFGIKSKFKVGGLDITAIMSMEKAEKKKMTVEGGAKSEEFQIEDYEYKRGTYYFLDSLYRDQFRDKFVNGIHGYNRDMIVTEIEVYKSDFGYENRFSDSRYAWCVLDPNQADTTSTNAENDRGYFVLLEPIKDYLIDRELGFIVMNMALQESEVLAVAYRDSLKRRYGTIVADSTTHPFNVPVFKLIKPRSPRPAYRTWPLEWKNVYNLGSRNIDKSGFELKLFSKPPPEPLETITINGTVRGLLDVFGLDRINKSGSPVPDNIIDDDNNILNLSRGELIFPDLQPFDPEKDSDLPDEKRSPKIYTSIDQTEIRQQSKFYIQVKSSSRSPNINLGINVIEGSEEVMLNGRKLEKDVGYQIDYFSGQLILLDPDATNPNAKLEVNYESQQMFTIDKKSMFGIRAEYKLWERANKQSFIGATVLYLNEKTLDKRVRVGKGPMRNLVWDVNTSLSFEPNFITRALQAVPFINASGPSTFDFEGEFAQVIPNPNTLNNESTGDNSGVAYLDDFEGAKKQTTLSVSYNAWQISSIPKHFDENTALSRRGWMYWYNPYYQVPIQDIKPNQEVTTAMGQRDRLNVLTLAFSPDTSVGKDSRDSWFGTTQNLVSGYSDQTNTRFIEMWIQGDHGRIHIDLGQISEDAIPNQKLNTEDKRSENGVRNQILDEGEDTGLDGVFGNDPPYLFYPHTESIIQNGTASPYDFWDVNGDGIKQFSEPWSYDDWSYSSREQRYAKINGTEDNRKAFELILPDDEDLNKNSGIDLNNDYFEFSFSLEKNHPDTSFIGGGHGNEKGWRLYRIPLKNNPKMKKIGNPDWSRIEYIRIWVDSVDVRDIGIDDETGKPTAYITFAEIDLVGNEWYLRGVVTGTDSSSYRADDDSTMTISVVNTHDNSEYTQPKGVEGEVDPIYNIRQREQSLVIRCSNLLPGSTSLAHKIFYQDENLIHYKTLKMFVHGGDWRHQLAEQDRIEFFLRIGSGNDTVNYYEVRIPVFDDWDERNNIEVHFDELMRLKILKANTLMIRDTLSNGHILTIRGEPSLVNIRWLMLGVHNIGLDPFSGELWINELRLSDVRKDKGIAMRIRSDIRISDLISFNMEYNQKDADFHTVNERFGEGSDTKSQTYNGSVQLDKFLPARLGLSIPISGNFSSTESTPKYLPKKGDILTRAVQENDTLMEQARSRNLRKGFGMSLSKRTKSRNFFIRYILDPVNVRMSYSYSKMTSSTVENNWSRGYNGSFTYNLTFGQQQYLEPFKWLGKGKIFSWISKSKFYYLPSSFNFDLQGTYNRSFNELRSGLVSQDTTATYARTLSAGYKPFNMLDLDYSRSFSSDMRYEIGEDLNNWSVIFSTPDPGIPTAVNQSVRMRLNPKIFNWLSHNVNYNSNYRWSDNYSMRDRGTGTNSSIGTTLSVSGNFDPSKFVQTFRKSKRTTAGRPAPRPKQPVTREGATPDSKDKNPEENVDKKRFSFLKVFSFGGTLFSKLDPVSISVNSQQNANHNGLLNQSVPGWKYQFGFSQDPGVLFSENIPETSRETRSKSYSMTLRSGFKLTSQISVSLDYSISDNMNVSSQTAGTMNKSIFLASSKKKDPLTQKETEKTIPFPGWSFQWRGMEKLPFLKKILKSASLSHSFSGDENTSWSDRKNNITSLKIDKNFRPLIGLNFTTKNEISGNMQFNMTESITDRNSGKSKQTSQTLTVTAKYSKRGGIKLPFMKGKKLDNNIDVSLNFNLNNNASYQSRVGDKFDKVSSTENWTLKPNLSYTFSRTVTGGVYFEFGKRKDLRAGDSQITAFGINANISLAGN